MDHTCWAVPMLGYGALWCDLCPPGPQEQSQQPPHSEEVPAAWQSEEAACEWEDIWRNKENFHVKEKKNKFTKQSSEVMCQWGPVPLYTDSCYWESNKWVKIVVIMKYSFWVHLIKIYSFCSGPDVKSDSQCPSVLFIEINIAGGKKMQTICFNFLNTNRWCLAYGQWKNPV